MVEAPATAHGVLPVRAGFVVLVLVAGSLAACETFYDVDDVPSGNGRFVPPDMANYAATPDQVQSYSFVDALVDREWNAVRQEIERLELPWNQDIINRIERERALLVRIGMDDDWDSALARLRDFQGQYSSFLFEIEKINALLDGGSITPQDAYERVRALGLERARYLMVNSPHEIAKELSSISTRVEGILTKRVVVT